MQFKKDPAQFLAESHLHLLLRCRGNLQSVVEVHLSPQERTEEHRHYRALEMLAV